MPLSTSPGQKRTIGRVMREYKHGELKSGPDGKAGKVKSRRQAVAIALSEAGASRKKSPSANRRNLARTKAKEAGKKASASRKSSAKGKRAAAAKPSRRTASTRSRPQRSRTGAEHARA